MDDSEVSVVWLDLTAGSDVADELFAALPDDEAARVTRLVTGELRRRATLRFARRRVALGHLLDVPATTVRLTHDDRGRLFALGPRGSVAVSSSSSGDVGLLAVASGHMVGADVESTGEIVDTAGFVDRVATDREAAVIAGLARSERQDTLARLWTRKEAYLKATGEGIGAGLAHVEVPLEQGLWAATFDPVAAGEQWLLYDLTPPTEGFAAALVVGPSWTELPEIIVSWC